MQKGTEGLGRVRSGMWPASGRCAGCCGWALPDERRPVGGQGGSEQPEGLGGYEQPAVPGGPELLWAAVVRTPGAECLVRQPEAQAASLPAGLVGCPLLLRPDLWWTWT